MSVVSLAIAMIVSASVPADPAALVTELGSPRYVRREAAAEALLRQGPSVIPALRRARDVQDPEIRARAASILARLEQDSLMQPTMVPLDFRDVPLVDAIQALNARTGFNLVLKEGDDPSWTSNRLNCRSATALPFWKALDQICQAGKMHPTFDEVSRTGTSGPSLMIAPGEMLADRLVSDSGPFRVHLASLHTQSDLTFGTSPDRASGRIASADDASHRSSSRPQRQFYAQLLVTAEPRLTLSQTGSVRITQATDDLGNSLLIPSGTAISQRSAGYAGVNLAPTLSVRVDLAQPDSAAGQIRTLSGVVPVEVSARKPAPTTVPLSQAVGKTFQDEDSVYTVLASTVAEPGRPFSIDLEIRPMGKAASTGGTATVARDRRELNPRQIEVLDASGAVLSWFEAKSSFDGDTTRATLSLVARGEVKPTSIRFHEISHARTEIPFEFQSVALP